MYAGWWYPSQQIKIVQTNGDKTMKNKIWMWIGGLMIALLVFGTVGTAVAYAQSPSTDGSLIYGHGPGGGRGPLGTAELDAAAKALGMTTAELSTALQSGKTLEQLATE